MKNSFFVLIFLCLMVIGSTQTSYQTNNFGDGQSMLDNVFSSLNNNDTPTDLLYGKSMQSVLEVPATLVAVLKPTE